MTAFTQLTDLTSTLIFGADNDQWTIAPNVSVAVSNGYGVTSNHASNTLINHGDIFSGNGIGVYSIGTNAKVVNAADGDSIGFAYGIFNAGTGGIVSNAGIARGATQAGVFVGNATTFRLDNSGEIWGHNFGAVVSGGQGGVVHNTGTISAVLCGLTSAATPGHANSIINGIHGVIQGGNDAIRQTLGATSLDNKGKVIGNIQLTGTNANDVVHNHGKVLGTSHLGTGSDRFDGHDGTQGKVFGDGGNDILIGGAKHDILNGGIGKDTLTGHGGKDYFDFDSITDSTVGGQRDFITDFHQTQHDRIDLATIDANAVAGGNQAFVFRGTSAFTGAGQVRYVLHDKAGTANDTTTIYANVDANLAPDMQIEVKGLVHFHANDFFL